MEEYLVHISYGDNNIINIKTDRLELRDGALIFYWLDETEGYKIARVIAAGRWIQIVKVIEIDGDHNEDE